MPLHALEKGPEKASPGLVMYGPRGAEVVVCQCEPAQGIAVLVGAAEPPPGGRTGRIIVPGADMHTNTASIKFTVLRSLTCGNWGEKPTNVCSTLLNRQIAWSAEEGEMASATTLVSVPVGQVSETLLQPVNSSTLSVCCA